MKKVLPAIAIVILTVCNANAQFLNIIRTGGNHSVNDSTIVVNGKTSVELTSTTFDVINTGMSVLNVKCKRYDTVVVPGTSNYLCWGLCFGPSPSVVWTAPSTQGINAGDTNKTFTADYNDSGKAGIELIRYIYYDASNPADSAWVQVKFNVINDAGIAPVAANSMSFSAPYPNPAASFTNFNYHVGALSHLTIYNSIGQEVKSMILNSSANKFSLNVSGMPSGIYICQLTADGTQPLYQKLVVAH